MLTEKEQLASADEEKIKTVGWMTNVAFRLGKVHALGDVEVLDVNTYDVLFGLPTLVALRANLDFDTRSIVLRNRGGKPYVVPMRLTLRTTTNVTPQVSPMMAGTLRVITWDNSTDDGQPSKDTDSSDEDDPVILEMAQQRIHYPVQRANIRSLSLTDKSLQRAQAMIMGEPLVQISRMVDSLEPPRTLYKGVSPLLARYNDKRRYCDITNLPRSLLTPAKEIRLICLGAETNSLEPPERLETGLGIKIAMKPVPWKDIRDGITPEEHVAIREQDAQMMATVFSWRSDNSFISAPPPENTKQVSMKHLDVRIWDELYELHVPQYVPDEIHHLIAEILKDYKGAISLMDTDIGLSLVMQHEIQTGNHPPIHCKPYRYSLVERKTTLERIREFEANVWIEPSTGPWSFPVVLVPEKNGSIRICIDYHKLNDITIKDVYPLPRIDDLLDAIGCANYFSKFDIRHGFHHILVKEEDRQKTAFVLFEGTWQWVRCPMGICNVPATFQRAMNMTFQNFVNKTRLTQGMINFCVIVYMDDILVYSETFHGHAQRIEWTLGALRDAGFKIALEKSEFFLSEISFLGYVVTRRGLRPDSRKVAEVKDVPVPTSLTQEYDFDIIHRKTERHGNADGLTRLHHPSKRRTTIPIALVPSCFSYSVLVAIAMSFLTERALGDHMLAPPGDISAIRQVHHPRFNPDLLRLAQFFSTTGVYAAAEFRFTGHRQAIVLAEAMAVRRLSASGVSHVSIVVIFSGDISAISPLRHTTIRTSLREWGQQLAAEWNQWLTRRGNNLVPTDDIDVGGLRRSRHEPAVVLPELLMWTRDIEHRAWIAYVELLIIQAWRTEVEGDLLGFLFGSVRPDHRQQIVQELTTPLTQLVDDLPLDIVSQCDETPEEDPEAARRREEIAVRKQPLELASGVDLPIPNDPAKDPEPPKNDDGDLAAETSSAPARRRRS
ncbi:hypothetical protein CBR_g31005 [Chara braunii]|uniref:Reverse transcriptase domain-containing protein n=1 Tax=Chara braunii TaxID=69332 RepID=A0A388LE16_CHABU|nr:hypothetical protein CBR_g31005 [Chara braunii]|eukprot:GBG80545.1 hypothetical protein CBR_g31005 [Chara braunii]